MLSEKNNVNYLAHNLRFLRKELSISQDKLSKDLGITRNKIASYESRNIEPKLELISKMANYFNIRIDDLIRTKLTKNNYDEVLASKQLEDKSPQYTITLNVEQEKALEQFVEENEKINKVVKGFKAFQEIKDEKSEKNDLTQLMEVMDYLLETNKNLILEINSSLSENK